MKKALFASLFIIAAIMVGCQLTPPAMPDGWAEMTETELQQAVADQMLGNMTTAAQPVDLQSVVDQQMTSITASNLPVIGVTIGLDSVDPAAYSGWSGPLADCELDSRRMASAWSALGVPVHQLLTERATIANVQRTVAYAAGQLAEGGLLLIHTSGHGGQWRDTSGDEADGLDEYLCLYDGGLSDDVINAMLEAMTKPIRILWICDTCNSGTMYRKPVEFRQDAIPVEFPGQLIIIAGCNEGDTSQSTGHGGVCTLAVLEVGLSGISPLALFDEAAEIAAESDQIMICNEYGAVTDSFRYEPFIPANVSQASRLLPFK
jgi:hypothetical protein